MIDTWFKKDLDKIYETHQIAVFIDESEDASFLLDVAKSKYKLYSTNTKLEELKAKYEIEKTRHNGSKFLIYTNTPKEKLKFIREYCETNGCVEIRYLHNYIQEKVHKNLNLNLNLDNEELASAAKISIGKDRNYWMDLSHKGASEIFDLEKELLPFLNDPKNYIKKHDKAVQTFFYKKINELIGQTYIKKAPTVLASEVVNHLLDSLVNNNPNATLLEIYNNWLDSRTYQSSFEKYMDKYELDKKSDMFAIHPNHPFVSIDQQWLKELGERIADKDFIQTLMPQIKKRISSKAAQNLGIDFWVHIKTLFEFDEKNINQLSSFQECVDFYTRHFYKLDNAIRNLYALFLTKKDLIEPIQFYYKNLVVIFLDKWFSYIDEYKSNQTGKLQEIIDNNSTKTAIVVGDGVSYEFATDITERVSNDFNLSKDHKYMFAGLPSETEHNMSQMYVETGKIIPTKLDREKYLISQNPDKEIGFIDLELINELTVKEHYLICSHKDPDKLGETYQQQALKHFDNIADIYAEKIQQLLKNGYQNVYLVSDHGYVLTGILTDSDKIEVDFQGTVKKNERYILTEKDQKIDKDLLIEQEIKYKKWTCCYFARRLGPFKTPGVYGFSHGGLSPQETIIPYLKWTREETPGDALKVYISNVYDLQEVTGDVYQIKLKAESLSDDLFTLERKIVLLFYSDGKKIMDSDIMTIEKDKEIRKDYSFGEHKELEVILLDAQTREQLDKVTIKQGASRDLGGIF